MFEPEPPTQDRRPPGAPSARPEILAPAGDPLSLRAAIAAGADAVYLGMARFNARGRAERFRGVTLDACVRAARQHGVRVHVTLNTLLHADELALALALAEEALEAGVHAVIVQDLGFAAALRRRLPELAVHGSTQMTVHGADQAVELVERLGLRRVIAARECSVPELARMAERIRPLGADLEVFVHGALCFAYSGQCLMSNFAGRRSANRGICAQNCRFDFSSAPGGSFRPLPVFEPRAATQLISMKDLAAFDSVAELADAGIASFKIEGRLKGPEYVAEVTRLYRAAVDAWQDRRPFASVEAERAAGRVFSRGFTNGYLAGAVGASMRGDKRSLDGEPDAVVLEAHRQSGDLLLQPRPGHEVRAGQGYRYAHDRYRGGFRVLAVRGSKHGACEARVRFGAEASGRRHRRGASGRVRPPPPLPRGLACYLNDDPDLERRVAALVAGVEISLEPEPVPLHIEVAGEIGQPLRARATAPDGRSAAVESSVPLAAAAARPLETLILEEHLGRMGGTGYKLASLDDAALARKAFLGFPALHELRREIVRRLDALGADRSAAPRPRAGSEPRLEPASAPRGGPDAGRRVTSLAVCVAGPDSGLAALANGAARVVLERVPSAADRSSGAEAWTRLETLAADVWLRLPPIVHDASVAELLLVDASHAAEAGWLRGVVAGHAGQLALARRRGLPCAADVYLNAYNPDTLAVLQQAGAKRVTLSLEVDAKEAARVASLAPPGLEVEVVVGGRVFSMLTRQDFGLANGESLAAVSEHGHAYIFESSHGITTLHEARELVGATVLPSLVAAVDSVRLDLSHHDAASVGEVVAAYAAAIRAIAENAPHAQDAATRAHEVHRAHAPHGAFPGHLIRGARSFDAGE